MQKRNIQNNTRTEVSSVGIRVFGNNSSLNHLFNLYRSWLDSSHCAIRYPLSVREILIGGIK